MRATHEDFLAEVRKRYEEQNEHIEDVSRLRNYVEHRCAVSNAVRPFCTYKDIGALFGKDHSSIVHYVNEHEPLLRWSPDYVRKYASACEIVEDVSDEMMLAPMRHGRRTHVNPRRRIDDIERIIFSLHKLRDSIIERNFPQK